MLPTWVRVIGALEIALGGWALASIVIMVASGVGGGWRLFIAQVGLAALAAASIWAGQRLLRRKRSGLAPSLCLLAVQSVEIITPLVAWVVTLGWSVRLVLYSVDNAMPDAGETIVALGGHERPSYFALNMLAFVPAVVLAMLWRTADVAARATSDDAPAP